MSIHVRPKNADDLVAALREDTASAEDLARIERGLARELRARTVAPTRSLLPAGIAVCVFAAAALLWFVRPVDDAPVVATSTVPNVLAGQVIEGPAPAEAQLGNAHLAVGARSSLRVDEIDITRAVVSLVSGEVRIAFHPEHRGEEHLAILTPAARVDIVGTELVVSISEDGGTRVQVIEGAVRVTPTSGEAATLVRGGEAIDVAIAVAAVEVEEVIEPAAPEVAVVEDAPAVRVPSAPAVSLADRIAVLAAHADDRVATQDYVAAIETETMILALDPRGEHGANALYDRALLRERRLHDLDAARADYERYLTEFPQGAFAAQAQQGVDRLSPSAP